MMEYSQKLLKLTSLEGKEMIKEKSFCPKCGDFPLHFLFQNMWTPWKIHSLYQIQAHLFFKLFL